MPRITLQFGGPFKLCFPGKGQWKLFVEEYWPWVGGICKCRSANARGFPGVNSRAVKTSVRQIMQTLSTLLVSIVILPTNYNMYLLLSIGPEIPRAHKRITQQSQQKISRPYFVVRFFYG